MPIRRRSVALLIAIVAIAVPAVVHATPTANPIKPCPNIKAAGWQFPNTQVKSTNYGSYVVGGYTCAMAASWIKKLSATSVKNRKFGSSNVLTNGPTGMVCTANPDAKGHAFAGSCRKGKGAATVGFGWGGRP